MTWELDGLLERIARDEAAAMQMEHYQVGDSFYHCCAALRTAEDAGDLPFGECDCGLQARQARALAEATAKRRIVEHGLEWSATLHETAEGHTEEACTAIRMTMEWVIDRIQEIYDADAGSAA